MESHKRSMENLPEVNAFTFETADCPICGSDDADLRYEITRFVQGNLRFVTCRNCSTIYQNPRPDGASMRDFYMTQNFFQSSGKNRRFVGYLDYDAEEAIRIKNAADRLHEIESYFPAGRQLRILEIAGGYGALTKLAGDRGHDATAIDFSRVMVDGARERYGISVIHADFMTHDFADARFDAVVLYGALGNFPDVTGAGRKIGTLLRSGGLYFTNFIEPRSIIERIQGPDFWLYRPPIIGIWTADAFAQAHQEFGFTLEKRLADVQWVSIGKLVGYLQSPAIRALARAMWIERLNLKLPTPGYVKVILRRK